MSEHDPTITDDPDQHAEALDDDKLPEEFPDRPVASLDYGVTEAEQAHGEPLDSKLSREEPDISLDDDDDDESSDDDDTTDDSENDDFGDDAPALLGDLDAEGNDDEPAMVGRAEEVDRDTLDAGERRGRTAEEAAMHIIDDEPEGATDRRSVRFAEGDR